MRSEPDPNCLFCAIVRRAVPASIVHEDATTLAFLDLHPINPGHTLVIPKLHAVLVGELSAAIGAAMFEASMNAAEAIRRSGLRCEGVNFFLADGAVAGQEVFHVHMHVIPRFANDGFGLKLPPGYGPDAPRHDLDRAATLIRNALGRRPD